jgi:hypothetical protein
MTNAVATGIPDWAGALIALGVAAALLALRVWMLSPWRGKLGAPSPERRQPLRWPAQVPLLRPASRQVRSSAGGTRYGDVRGPLIQPERASPSLAHPEAERRRTAG